MVEKDKIRYEKIMKALKKYGINSEAELYEAAKKQKPIEITCMVAKVPTQVSKSMKAEAIS